MSLVTPPTRQFRKSPASAALGYTIFFSRWLQAPLYLGLIVAQGVYVVLFMRELWHLITHLETLTETGVMLLVLGLIDVVMIANLLIMVIIGGYETFVSKINLDGHPDQPEWLSHVNANVLKVKLAMAIIGISSIHLLKTFIAVGDMGDPKYDGGYTWDGVFWQVIIHCVFIFSAMALAWIDKISHKAHLEAVQAHTLTDAVVTD
ncbi:TIGR00645 family protein [Leifsonia sp. Root4]|uniref:TIGR00645 family protein n=1 Tax=Leifsonia sp. Root4 TaxID=1736525 RepID=UPI000B33B52A|nr:TIGR00645 family protein [Leifsonia sp. Root4]